MDFQLRFLSYFLTIVEEQSFSKAAAKFGISQPSLSQRIQTLETQLGFPLLIRSARGVALTPEAQRLLDPFRELVGRGNRITRLARDVREGERRPIQLGVTMYSDRPERADLINAFLEAHPGKHVQLETIYTVELHLALLSARYDLGFSVGPPPDEDFEYLVIRHFRVELLIPAGSPLADLDEIPQEALVGLPIACIRRQRFPLLFDVALQPLEDAGAILTYPSDQTPMGLLTHSRTTDTVVAMAIPFVSADTLAAAGLSRRPVQGLDPPVALMLIRPKQAATHVGALMWDFAEAWIAARAAAGAAA
ncbi:transcriptional regulator, LysR family [Rhizorhabdus wittichii RW1]|uniref:Transcriptional regulator, LysR family n=1 Tax=Rhizorhabdus wittichii (strain DSM 6014 / CCUG 31198 / JCM 15750 / NBRC 105917 / EY 4224 / RW1) TaxID=392499 RepID=A0A9J9HB29_RHIWR|nr:transcriptional regulator, LysR family [Rhizorhabdus wittichii RW1]